MCSVKQIYNYLDRIAPFKNASKDDNVGLIVGAANAEVGKILVAIDATNDVIAEAAEKGAELIITHHPLMYRPVSKIPKGEPLHAMIRHNINFIAAHTNFDVADYGTTDIMLDLLGFPASQVVLSPENPDKTGFGRIVELDSPLTPQELAEKCKRAFKCSVVRYTDSNRTIKRVGLCSGGGDFLTDKALESGCDAYICGDVKWYTFTHAANHDLTLIDAGHFHTEDIFCEYLVERLREEFPGVTVEKSVNSVDVVKYC
ncbi:MAG: Nif3-like dinuclear metal center hexameric protein [Oscillospiraceae bacterium]|nr:Nif3-like dinuclear metal center hexameric protein [Oscillospiraceae bacterium]